MSGLRVGIIGGGQLGRMLALAGYPLGMQFRFLSSSPDAPAGQVGELVVGGFGDRKAVDRFVAGLDLVTYETENTPVEFVRELATRVPVYPGLRALTIAQDRLPEKQFFARLGVPTPLFAPVSNRATLETALSHVGLPALLKTRRMGYDGRGQFRIRTREEAEAALEQLQGEPGLLEQHVPFERELSLLAVRGRTGETAFYPLVENHHEQGILRTSLAPAPGVTRDLRLQAEGHVRRMLHDLDYVGVLAVEFFLVNGTLVANEMAPRVHNSGHWTEEGAETSQFENHLRAIAGLPLGSTRPVGHSAMLNLIGTVPEPDRILAEPGAHLHLYGKQGRPARKLGHITLRASRREILEQRVSRVRAALGG